MFEIYEVTFTNGTRVTHLSDCEESARAEIKELYPNRVMATITVRG